MVRYKTKRLIPVYVISEQSYIEKVVDSCTNRIQLYNAYKMILQFKKRNGFLPSEMQDHYRKKVERLRDQQKKTILPNAFETLKCMAENYEWEFVCYQEKNVMISFKKNFDYSKKPVRMNVYVLKSSIPGTTRLTISTSMTHPKKGNTQMFIKNVGMKTFLQLLENPRAHTGKRYQTKS